MAIYGVIKMNKNPTMMNLKIDLKSRLFGENPEPFIIAEMSGNHNQSLDRALEIVDAAAHSGVSALKIQTYTAETMTIDSKEGEFYIEEDSSLWKGSTLFELYEKAHTPWEWHKAIFNRCKEHGIIGFSSPFDETAVDFLEELNVPLYKIASFENTDVDLLKKVASTGKPVIVSTGMASLSDIELAVSTLRKNGCENFILLKCTSTYPATPLDSNINTIPHMSEAFGCKVGLSDHTLGIGVSVAAIAMGARVIEKHFTLRRADGGVDSTFSMEPDEMRQLVIETERAWQSLGAVHYGATNNESDSMKFRRSLYIVKDLKAGDLLNEDNVRAIRPGLGMPIKSKPIILGKRVNRDCKRGTPLSWSLIG